MKGMTNNQIIMNEAAKLDPATLHLSLIHIYSWN